MRITTQKSKLPLIESTALYNGVYDTPQRKVEQRLRSISELAEAALGGRQEAVLELQDIALCDGSDDVRVAAVEALGALKEGAPVVPLLVALRDSFWDVRAAAAQALGNLRRRTPIRHLIAHLKQETDMSVREAIVCVLGQQRDVALVKVLVKVLRADKSWLVREMAVWALGELGERAPLHALIYALRFDPSEQVRAAAATSLGQVGEKEVMAPLFKALEEDSSNVREAASRALQQLDIKIGSQETSEHIESQDLLFLEEWLSSNNSSSEEYPWLKEWQAFSTLSEYIRDKRGGVKAELRETKQGRALLLHCFYERPEESLQETLLPSIQQISVIEPIEAALQSRDDFVQIAVRKALEAGEQRKWFDLLVVSFVILQASEAMEQKHSPLHVIVSSMSCQRVREQDVLARDQLLEKWLDKVDEPLACKHPHDLADLKVWYHSASGSSARMFAAH